MVGEQNLKQNEELWCGWSLKKNIWNTEVKDSIELEPFDGSFDGKSIYFPLFENILMNEKIVDVRRIKLLFVGMALQPAK